MSIFKDTFSEEVKQQLKHRQDAISKRDHDAIRYLNTRNAWIRMSSSVDVNNDKGALARKYILQGGALNADESNKNLNFKSKDNPNGVSLKSGFANTYNPSSRGLRPTPGIASLDIKSKSAYGSLREVVVNFQCWNIEQLEDLELLYMRPGYTVLVEWGWSPYLDNKTGKLQPNFNDYYDIINKGKTDRTEIFKALFQKSKDYSGNYDAMFGYVRNYSWSARPDGGYDCQTTIISTGEIIESLKVNYVDPKVKSSKNGLLAEQMKSGYKYVDSNKDYSKNILAGLCAELYNAIKDNKNINSNSILSGGNIKAWKLQSTDTDTSNKGKSLTQGGLQCYITIKAFFELLNKYVIFPDTVKLSTQGSEITSDNGDLLCVAHPLQVSIDPTVCIINSPLWAGGQLISEAEKSAKNNEYKEIVNIANEAYSLIDKGALTASQRKPFVELFNSVKFDTLQLGIEKIFSKESLTLEVYSQLNSIIEKNNRGNLEQLLKITLSADEESLAFLKKIENKFNSQQGLNLEYSTETKYRPKTDQPYDILAANSLKIKGPENINFSSLLTIINKSPTAIQYIEKLKEFKDYFYNNDPNTELGIIGNIFLNVDFLYKQALDINLEAEDKKEKNDITLYNYIKRVMYNIQSCLGSVNNFEIHVDPIDNNIARLIDINYTGPKVDGRDSTYNKLFELQVHNTQSTVRSYTLQSQIFPEQSAIIAIGSQAKGGQLGMQNNTIIDFNRLLIDRIIPKDEGDLYKNEKNLQAQLNSELADLINLFSCLATKKEKDQPDFQSLSSQARNSLRDLIVYFQSITTSTGKNRNLIPVKFSFEMDGIGGLVIGHMFRLPNNILPRGYKGEKGVGSQLGQAITSIGHTITNGDWVTKIDALNIVLNDNKSQKTFLQLLPEVLKSTNNATEGVAITEPISTKDFNQDRVATAVKFFINKGYEDYQIAAIVGGLLQESGLDSTQQYKDAYGIAQWRKERLTKLQSKLNYKTLPVQLQFVYEEFKNDEKTAGDALKNSSTLEDAIAAMSAYERFAGINTKDGVTYSEVLAAGYETGSRIGFARDILSRIQKGEFTQ
jgi:hypothetical protein